MRVPAYLNLSVDELRARAETAVASLADCRACPRDCRVNRLEDAWSACKTGRHAVVSSAFPHFGEEDCLRGWNGSGTIFFGHCNLRCVFGQNYDISQDIKPQAERGSSAAEIAARAPIAVRLGKEAVNHAFESFLSEGIADERRAFHFLFSSEDQKEGMQAFIDKRKPQWKGK